MRRYFGSELVCRLSELFGPSGCENNVSDFIVSQTEDFADAYCIDRAGNVIVKYCGGGKNYDAEKPKRIMLSSHMDEVGIMINDFTEEGYIKFSPIGSIDPSVLCGRHITIGDESKKISGIIASKAIHMQSKEEREKAVPVSKLNIDIGAESEEEARRLLSVGDVGVFESEFITFGKENRYFKGKALKGRVACAAMIEMLRELYDKKAELPFDLYLAFTCCEEIAFSAARVAAQTIRPDAAIVLDSVEADDVMGQSTVKLGEGIVMSFADKGAIYDRRLVELAIKECEKDNVKFQIKESLLGKTGALHIQRSCEGVKVLSIALPVRYINTAASVCDSEDYLSLKNFLSAFLRSNKL